MHIITPNITRCKHVIGISDESSDLSIASTLPTNPILSSTRVGDHPVVAGSDRAKVRRRRLRIDSDEEEGEDVLKNDDDIRSAALPLFNFDGPPPTPGLLAPPRYASSQLNSSALERHIDSENDGAGNSDDDYDGDSGSSVSADDGPGYSSEEEPAEGEQHAERAGRQVDAQSTHLDADLDALTAPTDTTTTNAGDDVDVEALNRLQRLAKGAARKVAKHPRAKLDSVRLLGDQGLPALIKLLQKVKFKGRGHEFEDLNRLFFLYESWANRMLPNFSFKEIIERLEVVGTKREVHNTLQRMRAGVWPVSAVSAEFVDEPDDGDSSGYEADQDVMRAAMEDVLAENAQSSLRPPIVSGRTTSEEVILPAPVDRSHPSSRENSPPPRPSTSTAVLPDEESIKDRIERNRRRAMERLEARRRSALSSSSQSLTSPGRPSILKNALAASVPANNS